MCIIIYSERESARAHDSGRPSAATDLQQSCNRAATELQHSSCAFNNDPGRPQSFLNIRSRAYTHIHSVCCMRLYNKRCMRPSKGCIQPYKRLPGAYFKASYTKSLRPHRIEAQGRIH
jgi:hypothetical protein